MNKLEKRLFDTDPYLGTAEAVVGELLRLLNKQYN